MGTVSSQPVVPTQVQGTQQHEALDALRPTSSSTHSEITVDPLIQGTKSASKAGSKKRKRASDNGSRTAVKETQQEQTSPAFAMEEATVERVAKKKAKKTKAAPQVEEETMSTRAPAKALAHVAIPVSASDTPEAASTAKTAKKRKQPTGRPSGLSFVPPEIEDGEKQSSPPVPSFTAINSPTMRKAMLAPNMPSSADDNDGSQVTVTGAEKLRKKSKKRKHSSGEEAVEAASEVGSQQAMEKPKDSNRRSNADDDRHSPDVLESPTTIEKKKKKKKKKRDRQLQDDPAVDAEGIAEVALDTTSNKSKTRHRTVTNAIAGIMEEEEEANDTESGRKAKKRKKAHTSDKSSERSSAIDELVAPVEITSMAPQSARSSASTDQSVATESTISKRKTKVKRKSQAGKHTQGQTEERGGITDDAEEVASTKRISNDPFIRYWLSGGPKPSAQRTGQKHRPQATSAPEKPGKRASQDSEDDASDYQPVEDDVQAQLMRTPKSAVRPSSAPERQDSVNPRKTQHDGIDKGFFTATEKAIADEVFSDVCEQENLTNHQLKVQIQSWTTCTVFKTALNDALPRRSMAALRKFAKTRYTPMERGVWTTEQDNRLRAAHTEYPGRWNLISELVERPAQDCKDRWVNHLKYGEKEIGAWSQMEEADLMQAVRKCLKAIKKGNKGDDALRKDRARLESMINWEAVASQLGGKRPARRCRIKWEKLKSRTSNTQEPEDMTVVLRQDDSALSQKMSRASKRYVRARIGNKIEMLMEIYEVVNQDKVFDRETTLWSYIALANPFSKYDSSMRRWNYYACLNASKTVRSQPSVAATAFDLVNELLLIHGEKARWDKARSRDLKAKPVRMTGDALVENADSGNRPRYGRRSLLSKENISDSSSDEEEEEHESESGASPKENVEVSGKESAAASQQQRRMQTPTPARQQEFASPLTISSINSAWERDRRSPVLSKEQFQAMVRKRVGGSSPH